MSLYRLQALIHQKVTLLILVVAHSCHHFLLFHADDVLKEEAADLETLLRQEREREKARHEKDLPVEVGL